MEVSYSSLIPWLDNYLATRMVPTSYHKTICETAKISHRFLWIQYVEHKCPLLSLCAQWSPIRVINLNLFLVTSSFHSTYLMCWFFPLKEITHTNINKTRHLLFGLILEKKNYKKNMIYPLIKRKLLLVVFVIFTV